MFEQPPFPPSSGAVPAADAHLAVVVPTRNRPERLERCLGALAAARESAEFRVYVCDSSTEPHATRVAEVCGRHPFVELVTHDRVGAAAARNVGNLAAAAELVACVDDDVYVEPGAIASLLGAYDSGAESRVVAGSVDWGSWRSGPQVMRRIGYARQARPEERTEFLVSAFVLYPRKLGLALPWNERLTQYEDRFASLLWRRAGAELQFASDARARHDDQHNSYSVHDEADRIYANLFDALFVSRSVARLLAFEFLGFAACAKKWARTPSGALGLIRAWLRGHVAFVRDFRRLRIGVVRAREYSQPA